MKISLSELKSIIKEAVDKKLAESPIGQTGPVNWADMRFLLVNGKLRGSWRIIMTAMMETNDDTQKALQLLKASVAKLESKLQSEPKPEMASTEDLTDMSKL